MPPVKDLCNIEVHDVHKLETRTAVLETKIDYIETTITENKTKLNSIDNKLDGIVTHITRQNGTIPRMEENVHLLLQNAQEQEKITIVSDTRTKLIWGLVVSIVLLIGGIAVKFLIGL